MIYKKGDPENPQNFRGISLINIITKIFTSILEKRLSHWAEESNILNEGQAGFRKRRGCVDNIFNLYTAVCMNIRFDKTKVYATFADFKYCFDSICHKLLWRKLFTLRVSGKIIRVLRHMYNNATMKIKTQGRKDRIEIQNNEVQIVWERVCRWRWR